MGEGADPQPLIGGERVVTGYDRAGGTMAFTVSTVDRPAELYVIVGDGPERRLTTVTERFAARARLQPAERFVAPSTDGVEVDCWVIMPPDFDPAQRYPVLLNVHGGPFTQYGDRFFDEAQIQAAAGFVVRDGQPPWLVGPRAGVGPGDHAARTTRRRPGAGGARSTSTTCMAVLDEALRRYPFGDPDRVGMLGGSYGGYMATWLAGRHATASRPSAASGR